MIRKIITYTLAIVSIACIYLASGIRDVANWREIAKPFFIIWFITLAGSLILSNINNIRRFTYPAVVCLSAWSYKHKIMMTNFTRSTYRVYKAKNSSYSDLFNYTQTLFDIYLKGLRRQ